MEVKRFTGEEMDALRQNPYTYKVTQCHLSFTAEFKELFWKHYNEGMTPRDILASLGYDPDVLGENRVNGIRRHIKEESGKQDGFVNGRRPRNASAGAGASVPIDAAEEARQLRGEVEYLRQEVEFLKKISSIRTSGKQVES